MLPSSSQPFARQAKDTASARNRSLECLANIAFSTAVSAGSSRLPLPLSATALRQLSKRSQPTAPQQGPDLSKLSPKLQQQWHHAKNAHLGNVTITPGIGRKVWWRCDQCPEGHPHEFEASPLNLSRAKGKGCPLCAGKAVCHHNSLATKAPAIAAEWSSKNKKTAEYYTVGSSVKGEWQCKQCGHEWNARIHSRTSNKSGCPACSSRRRARAYVRRATSTESEPGLMQKWDWEANAAAGLCPSTLSCGSSAKVHWICHNCPKGQPHRWAHLMLSSLSSRHGG